MTDCIFCKIVKGEIPCTKLYETEHSFAFLDIAPLSKGHTLVIPKKHAESIYEMSEEQMADIGKVAHKLAPAVKNVSQAEGLNLLQNNGGVSGQFVMHFHLHLIPRAKNDGLGYRWNAGKYEKGEIEKVQKSILEKLK